jgi:hypothetical protein
VNLLKLVVIALQDVFFGLNLLDLSMFEDKVIFELFSLAFEVFLQKVFIFFALHIEFTLLAQKCFNFGIKTIVVELRLFEFLFEIIEIIKTNEFLFILVKFLLVEELFQTADPKFIFIIIIGEPLQVMEHLRML